GIGAGCVVAFSVGCVVTGSTGLSGLGDGDGGITGCVATALRSGGAGGGTGAGWVATGPSAGAASASAGLVSARVIVGAGATGSCGFAVGCGLGDAAALSFFSFSLPPSSP